MIKGREIQNILLRLVEKINKYSGKEIHDCYLCLKWAVLGISAYGIWL